VIDTHYQRLGVDPDASDAEIRDAYRRLARRVHPDAPGGSAQEMALLNEAWRVLRDPERRRAYDGELGRSGATTAGLPPAGSPPGGPGVVPAERVIRGLPWVAVLAVLALIFVFTAFARRDRPTGPAGVDGYLEPGSCVAVAIGRPATEVPCDGPHDGVVVNLVPFAQPCPAGTDSAVNPANTLRVCVRAVR
jgi:hypothetical protein